MLSPSLLKTDSSTGRPASSVRGWRRQPPMRCASNTSMGVAVAAPAPVQGLWHLLRHYRQWGQRRWRLTVHIRSQKVLERTAQQLAGGRPKEEVIVGWGNVDTGYGCCISRSGRGPNMALLRLLADKYAHLVVYVDEYYTSQGRDANSATNVRHALMEMLLGRARPAALRRGGDGGGGGPGLTSSSSGGSSNSGSSNSGSSNSGSSNSGSSSSGTGPGSGGTGPSSCGEHVRSGGGEQGHVEDGGERGAAQEAAPVLRLRPAGVWLGSLLASIAQLSMWWAAAVRSVVARALPAVWLSCAGCACAWQRDVAGRMAGRACTNRPRLLTCVAELMRLCPGDE